MHSTCRASACVYRPVREAAAGTAHTLWPPPHLRRLDLFYKYTLPDILPLLLGPLVFGPGLRQTVGPMMCEESNRISCEFAEAREGDRGGVCRSAWETLCVVSRSKRLWEVSRT